MHSIHVISLALFYANSLSTWPIHKPLFYLYVTLIMAQDAPKRDFLSHVHNYSTNVQKALTHEHPSGESADEVKAEGVVFFNT